MAAGVRFIYLKIHARICCMDDMVLHIMVNMRIVTMKRKIAERTVLIAFAFAVIASAPSLAEGENANGLVVKLSFDQFPLRYTCDGEDLSPEIQIQGLNSTSMAIIAEDPDAPSGTFTHWTIWNIPPVDTIPEGISKKAILTHPISARQGKNDFGEIGYAGPCPPAGKPHRYFFRVFGLDTMLELKEGSSSGDLKAAMQGHVLQEAVAIASYGRQT